MVFPRQAVFPFAIFFDALVDLLLIRIIARRRLDAFHHDVIWSRFPGRQFVLQCFLEQMLQEARGGERVLPALAHGSEQGAHLGIDAAGRLDDRSFFVELPLLFPFFDGGGLRIIPALRGKLEKTAGGFSGQAAALGRLSGSIDVLELRLRALVPVAPFRQRFWLESIRQCFLGIVPASSIFQGLDERGDGFSGKSFLGDALTFLLQLKTTIGEKIHEFPASDILIPLLCARERRSKTQLRAHDRIGGVRAALHLLREVAFRLFLRLAVEEENGFLLVLL